MILKTDTLCHYGVLGMKWGVRHDRKSSGGSRSGSQPKKSQGSSSSEGTNSTSRPRTTREAKAKARKINRERWTLSDAEIDRQINRLQKQQRLRQLTDDEVTPGRRDVRTILKGVAKTTATVAATAAVAIAIDRTLGRSANDVLAELGGNVANGMRNRVGAGGNNKKNKG